MGENRGQGQDWRQEGHYSVPLAFWGPLQMVFRPSSWHGGVSRELCPQDWEKAPKRKPDLCQEPSPAWWCPGNGGDWISILRYIISSTNWFKGAKGPATGFIDLLGKITVHAFSPESNCLPLRVASLFLPSITGLQGHLTPGPVPAFPWLPVGPLHFPMEPSHWQSHACALLQGPRSSL